MKIGIIYNLATKELGGIIQVSQDADLMLNVQTGNGCLEIPPNHPFLSTPSDEWEIKTNESGVSKVIRKPEDVIQRQKAEKEAERQQREERTKKERFTSLYTPILKEINELRKKAGLPEKTINEMYAET